MKWRAWGRPTHGDDVERHRLSDSVRALTTPEASGNLEKP